MTPKTNDTETTTKEIEDIKQLLFEFGKTYESLGSKGGEKELTKSAQTINLLITKREQALLDRALSLIGENEPAGPSDKAFHDEHIRNQLKAELRSQIEALRKDK